MWGYAFQSESTPPRTIYRETSAADAECCEDRPMSRSDQALANILPDFPEAYRAFIDEMNRLRTLGERSP